MSIKSHPEHCGREIETEANHTKMVLVCEIKYRKCAFCLLRRVGGCWRESFQHFTKVEEHCSWEWRGVPFLSEIRMALASLSNVKRAFDIRYLCEEDYSTFTFSRLQNDIQRG